MCLRLLLRTCALHPSSANPAFEGDPAPSAAAQIGGMRLNVYSSWKRPMMALLSHLDSSSPQVGQQVLDYSFCDFLKVKVQINQWAGPPPIKSMGHRVEPPWSLSHTSSLPRRTSRPPASPSSAHTAAGCRETRAHTVSSGCGYPAGTAVHDHAASGSACQIPASTKSPRSGLDTRRMRYRRL